MTIESARGHSAWRLSWLGAVAVAVAVAAVLLTACSGSSAKSGSGATRPTVTPPPGTRPRTTTPATGTQPGTTKRVVLVPSSIDATGHSDVTQALQRFIARTPNGSIVRFRARGRYRVEGTLLVRKRRDLTFDGQGAAVFATTRGGPKRGQWRVQDGSHIVFRNLVVRGANPKGGTSQGAYVRKLETQHGFQFEGVNGAELSHVEVTDVYGDFVYIGRDKHRVASRDIWIHDSTFRRNGRQGIAVTAAFNVIIERNTIDHTRRSTIDLEPNAHSWHVSNVFVLDNTVGKGRLLFVASHGQGPVNDVLISGNQLHGHSLTIDEKAPDRQRRSNWVITDNVSDTPVHSRPMRFAGVDGLVVRGNSQSVTNKKPGVVLTDDCGALVSSNAFGTGGIRRTGTRCAAPVAIPKAPAIMGRNGPRPPTPSTVPRSTPSSQPRRGTTPATVPHHGGGRGSAPWLALAVAVCVIVAIGLLVRARRARKRAG